MIDWVSLTVNLPVSSNKLYSYVPKLRQPVPSHEYTKFKRHVAEQWLLLRSHGRIDLGEDVCAWMLVFPPRDNADAHNFQKVLFDCLEGCGAVRNDKLITSVRIERAFRVRGGSIFIHLCNKKRLPEMERRFDFDMKTALLCVQDVIHAQHCFKIAEVHR